MVKPYAFQAFSKQVDCAEKLVRTKRNFICNTYATQTKNQAKPRLLWEYQGNPHGEVLYNPFISSSLKLENLWYTEYSGNKHINYFAVETSESTFWDSLEEECIDTDYHKKDFKTPLQKFENITFLSENMFNLSHIPDYNVTDLEQQRRNNVSWWRRCKNFFKKYTLSNTFFIEKIQVNKKYIELNFLSQKFLQMQKALFIKENFPDTYEYKIRAYKYILENEDFTNSHRLQRFVSILDDEPEPHLSRHVVQELTRRGYLSNNTVNS